MNFFGNTHTKRSKAFLLLLVWLFAQASSFANACLLETHEPHATEAKVSLVASGPAPAELLGKVRVDPGHHDEADGTKASCLKACDDGTRTLPKTYPGVDHNDPGPAPLVATLWTGSSNVLPPPRQPDDLALPTVGPPLRVRYSRLAL
jgi:hypothetical protein